MSESAGSRLSSQDKVEQPPDVAIVSETGRGESGGKPSICIATIHHVRQYMDGELQIDRFLESLNDQTDLPDEVLILDIKPDLEPPHLERFERLAGRVRVLRRPMKTIQEGFWFYSEARNELLAACRQEVMIWLDADERPDPDVVEKVRRRFADDYVAAGIIRLRPLPRYWERADELRYFAQTGHMSARLRIFRTDLLRSLGGFEERKPEWGSLASKIYPLADNGQIEIRHDKIYASHESVKRILTAHPIRALSHYKRSKRSIVKSRLVLVAYTLFFVIPVALGRPVLGLFILLVPPVLLYLNHLVKSLKALGDYSDAGPIHVPGAALLGLIESFNHVVSTAMSAGE
jgi:hypothetical protein